MERSRLELLLEQELLQNAQQARILCGSPVTRFVRSVQTAGGVAAVRESCRRNRPSDAFDSLVQAGRKLDKKELAYEQGTAVQEKIPITNYFSPHSDSVGRFCINHITKPFATPQSLSL